MGLTELPPVLVELLQAEPLKVIGATELDEHLVDVGIIDKESGTFFPHFDGPQGFPFARLYYI